MGGGPAAGWAAVFTRLALAAAIAGTGTAAAATGRISWSLALSGTVCWATLIALQLVTAAAVIIPVTRRHSAPMAPFRGGTATPWHFGALLALFFHAHAPWSLWILATSAFVLAAPGFSRQDVILATALVPLAWTAVIASAYFREVLGAARGTAIIATFVHQALTAAVMLAYIAWAVQLWPRLLGLRIP